MMLNILWHHKSPPQNQKVQFKSPKVPKSPLKVPQSPPKSPKSPKSPQTYLFFCKIYNKYTPKIVLSLFWVFKLTFEHIQMCQIFGQLVPLFEWSLSYLNDQDIVQDFPRPSPVQSQCGEQDGPFGFLIHPMGVVVECMFFWKCSIPTILRSTTWWGIHWGMSTSSKVAVSILRGSPPQPLIHKRRGCMRPGVIQAKSP